jgi:Diguanylate cyclase, GGDEF domain
MRCITRTRLPITREMAAAPTADPARRRQMARTGSVLFAAAAVVTVLGVLLPHQQQIDTDGLLVVAVGSGLMAALLAVCGERLPAWSVHLWIACGTALVSFALLFNGERHGGAAGGDEMYYLWVVLVAAYYLGRAGTAAQVALIAACYTATLIAIDPGPIGVSRWLTTVGRAIGSAVVVRLLSERSERLLAELRLAASTDPLTGLPNRRAFEERLAQELARARRTDVAFGLVLADVDHFKQLNDRYGHAAGDEALIELGRLLQQEMRGSAATSSRSCCPRPTRPAPARPRRAWSSSYTATRRSRR